MADKCLAKPSRSLLQLAILGVRLHEENHLRFSNSKHFRFYWTTKNFFSEWHFTKNHEIGSPVLKKYKNRDTHGRIVSLDQLRLGVEEQLLIFSSCLSPGRVKKLQKFINFCLKVGHSANLKHWKSAWRLLWNVQNQHIAERERSTTVVVLISGAFVWSRLIYERCLHLLDKFAYIAVPTITCSLRYA